MISAADLYADDTAIYDQQFEMSILERNLQLSLNSLHDWCRENGMVLNTVKTKVMLIASRQERNNLNEVSFSFQYNDIDIRMTTSDKMLGVHVDDNLSWNDYFHHVSKKVSSYLWLLSKIKTYLSKSIGFYITILISNPILIIVVLFEVIHQTSTLGHK